MITGHRYHVLWKRAAYSFAFVTGLLLIGTLGMHAFEHLSYLDAFYFMSMIATAQGPALIPSTPSGKLFAAFMSFISVGTVVAALGYLFGPFFTRVWKISLHKLEDEEKLLEAKFKKRP